MPRQNTNLLSGLLGLAMVVDGMKESDYMGLYYRSPPIQYDVNNNVIADRTYYIACQEILWDYAPSGYDLYRGIPITESSTAGTWLYPPDPAGDRIGRKYVKGLYREFTDATFTKRKPFDKEWKHLGAIGPLIRAIEGETIKIVYKNMCRFPNSMHPHGVFYDKTSEGAPYADGSLAGDIVFPGKQWTYIWKARENSVDKFHGSKMWLYHSHVDEIKDLHTGLIGPIIITKKAKERTGDLLYKTYQTGEWESHDLDCMDKDVDREFVNFFVLYNENESLLFDENLRRLNRSNGGQVTDELISDPDFEESNLMHSINGYLFGNIRGLNMVKNEIVRWFVASFGNEADSPHSPHWHGNILTSLDERTDTVLVIAGTTATADMFTDNNGTWLYHCHVFDHIEAGMITTYYVAPDPNEPYGTPIEYNPYSSSTTDNSDDSQYFIEQAIKNEYEPSEVKTVNYQQQAPGDYYY